MYRANSLALPRVINVFQFVCAKEKLMSFIRRPLAYLNYIRQNGLKRTMGEMMQMKVIRLGGTLVGEDEFGNKYVADLVVDFSFVTVLWRLTLIHVAKRTKQILRRQVSSEP